MKVVISNATPPKKKSNYSLQGEYHDFKSNYTKYMWLVFFKPFQRVLCAYSIKRKLKRERIVLEQADHHTYFMEETLNTRISQTNSNHAHNKK